MKKLFVASAFLGLASISQAAFISCDPKQQTVVDNGVGLDKTFNCNPGGNNVDGDGLAISQIRLKVSGSFQENAGVIPTYSVTFSSFNNGSLLATGSFTIGAVNCTASGATNDGGQALGSCSNTSAWVNVAGSPDSVPQFKVTVSGGPGSTPLPFNASASVAYEVSTVPEPATYSMMAAGLLALGFARRRKQ